jgi:phosphatidylinositol alpha-1,6-mannosyltransferase
MKRAAKNRLGKQAWFAVVGDAYGGRGGIAQYNRDFFNALAGREGVSSITILPRLAPDSVNPPPGVEQLPARSGRVAYAIVALLEARWRHIDVIFCGHLYMAPLAWIITYLKGAKLVVQTHGVEAWPVPSRLQRAAIDAADLVLCVSRYTRKAILKWANIVPERVVVVPNTVRENFKPVAMTDARSLLRLGSQRVLLTVARMDAGQRYKGHERVIDVIPGLVASGHDIVYLIVGEGDDRPRLEAYARDAGVSDRVRFLGAVRPEALAGIYGIADLFVMPSTGEGFGIAFLEAMASGTPAIGLSTAGACDALADGELGTAVPPEELGAAIAGLLLSPRPDPVVLYERTRARFGRVAYRTQINAALDRVGSA